MPEGFVTWWPADGARDLPGQAIVLMRYDWPDGERIYQFGIYMPGKFFPWEDGCGGTLQTPDYFALADQVVPFVQIPAECEYTYNPKGVSASD